MKKILEEEKDTLVYDEEGELKKLPSKFKYRKIVVNNFRCVKTGGVYGLQTIYATYAYHRTASDLVVFEPFDTPRLFLDTLSLIARLHKEFNNPPQSHKKSEDGASKKNVECDKKNKTPYFDSPKRILFFDKDIRPKAIQQIIAWCQKYGFPFAPEIVDERKARPLIRTHELENHIHFSVAEFLYELYQLYSAFRLYQAITGNVEYGDSNALIFTPIRDAKMSALQVQTERLGTLTTAECQKRLADMYLQRKFECHVSFADGQVHAEMVANTVFDAAYYQLAMLLNEPERVLKKCPVCDTYFEPNHARQKYCSNPKCTPQKAYKRRWLAEKKKAVE